MSRDRLRDRTLTGAPSWPEGCVHNAWEWCGLGRGPPREASEARRLRGATMIGSRVVALLVLGSLILAIAGQSAAQVRYVDETGGVHWAQSAEQIPEKYRGKASAPE